MPLDMASWFKILYVMVQSSILFHLCKGAIECACTTEECRQDNKLKCEADYLCYVQYIPGVSTEVVRGCIDRRTPLLCENRRPEAYTGSWPILLCCKDDWCNRDSFPTLPPYLSELENKEQPRVNLEGDIEKGNTESYKHIPPDENSHLILTRKRERPAKTINPLYIAVPVAGACVLLAIIIFAIYVLKRQNQYLDEYRYHSHLRQQQQKQHLQIQHNGIPVDIKDLQTEKKTMYTECERSSSGSETKLLMKV